MVGQSGISRGVSTGTSAPIAVATIGTTYPLLGIRKRNTFRDISAEIHEFQVYVSSNTDILLWSIQLNPTFSAPLTYNPVANSAIDFGIGNGSITITAPGTILTNGIVTTSSVFSGNILEDNFLSYLGSTLANVMDIICVCATPLSASINAYATLGYKEY